MLAVGCIQALKCNNNTCPTGVATQNKSLMKGLNVEDKSNRVYYFHKRTVHSLVELVAAVGLSHPGQLTRKHILHRRGVNELISYAELYPEGSW